jgi:hypothetical protein
VVKNCPSLFFHKITFETAPSAGPEGHHPFSQPKEHLSLSWTDATCAGQGRVRPSPGLVRRPKPLWTLTFSFPERVRNVSLHR